MTNLTQQRYSPTSMPQSSPHTGDRFASQGGLSITGRAVAVAPTAGRDHIERGSRVQRVATASGHIVCPEDGALWAPARSGLVVSYRSVAADIGVEIGNDSTDPVEAT